MLACRAFWLCDKVRQPMGSIADLAAHGAQDDCGGWLVCGADTQNPSSPGRPAPDPAAPDPDQCGHELQGKRCSHVTTWRCSGLLLLCARLGEESSPVWSPEMRSLALACSWEALRPLAAVRAVLRSTAAVARPARLELQMAAALQHLRLEPLVAELQPRDPAARQAMPCTGQNIYRGCTELNPHFCPAKTLPSRFLSLFTGVRGTSRRHSWWRSRGRRRWAAWATGRSAPCCSWPGPGGRATRSCGRPMPPSCWSCTASPRSARWPPASCAGPPACACTTR